MILLKVINDDATSSDLDLIILCFHYFIIVMVPQD